MLDQGRVMKIENNLAWVEFTSNSGCSRCGACVRGASGKMMNQAENTIGAQVGELVEVDISPQVMTLFPLIAFGVPIGLFFIGLVLGSLISEFASVVVGLLLLLFAFTLTRMIDRYIAGEKRFRSRIVRRLKEGQGEGRMRV